MKRKKKRETHFSAMTKTCNCYLYIHFSTTLPNEEIPKGLSTWRREDPSTRKILERGTTFRSIYMHKFRSVWLTVEKGIKIKDYPLNESHFVLFVSNTRIFLAKAVYMVLVSSNVSAVKILARGASITLWM